MKDKSNIVQYFLLCPDFFKIVKCVLKVVVCQKKTEKIWQIGAV